MNETMNEITSVAGSLFGEMKTTYCYAQEIGKSAMTLGECEAIIERGLKTFCEVGAALLTIRDERFYRADYSTFEDYCRERWGMSRIHAHRLIEASEVVENLRVLPIGNTLPETESQARPLSLLPASEQAEAWQSVVVAAGEAKITAGQVEQAVRSIIKGREKSEQIAAVKESFANLATSGQGQATVFQVDALTFLQKLPDRRADLLLTDPPYMTHVEDIRAFAHEWLPLALSKVARTGRAYVCIGQYPDELLAYLTAPRAGLELVQVLTWTYRNTLGPSPTYDYKLNAQAILYFRGPDAPPLDCPVMNEQFSVQDINAPDGRLANRFHEWQKPDELAERFIRHSTTLGQTVIDPFAGTGCFIAAAARLGRVGFGSEVDAGQITLCCQRGVVSAAK